MKFRNFRMPKLFAAFLAAVGFVTFTATPSSAHPTWQTYSADSNWQCGPSEPLTISTQAVSQVCLIWTPNRKNAQAVVVVSNRSDKTIELKGGYFDSSLYGAYDSVSDLDGGYCGFHKLVGKTARACFGETVDHVCSLNPVAHSGIVWANNADADFTAPLRTKRTAGC
ncbi:hypothetical protein [Streptomyces sp. NBC_01614]|uniref:hypothetical protein n=1 Tax=Streptomyces sp. NBC_01614 TaxID=2975897 RepID=UPI00386354F9